MVICLLASAGAQANNLVMDLAEAGCQLVAEEFLATIGGAKMQLVDAPNTSPAMNGRNRLLAPNSTKVFAVVNPAPMQPSLISLATGAGRLSVIAARGALAMVPVVVCDAASLFPGQN